MEKTYLEINITWFSWSVDLKPIWIFSEMVLRINLCELSNICIVLGNHHSSWYTLNSVEIKDYEYGYWTKKV